MWTQYRRTLWFTQLLIFLVAFAILRATQYAWPAAMVFFAVMQLSAVVGAMWGLRLKRKIERPTW